MFGFFKKDPVKKMEKEYYALLEKGRDIQRSGDIKGYAQIMADAEELLKKIEEKKAEK